AAAAERGVVQIGEKRHFRERRCGLPDSLPISTPSDFFFFSTVNGASSFSLARQRKRRWGGEQTVPARV
ncbi:MAG: hypothetical protein IKB53_06825, partial [Oscillospiraceae bacterium]|nr:hypothetical protein [Oscillospiraceae bacterium]